MTFGRFPTPLLTLLLMGCASWSGPQFYSLADGKNWLPPGKYRSYEGKKVSYFRWDGKRTIDLPSGKKEKDEGPPPILVPLSGTKMDSYIAQWTFNLADGKVRTDYVLFVRNGNAWTYVFPDCVTTKAIVLDAGGSMDGPPPGMHKQTSAENVTMADLNMEPLSAIHRRKRDRRFSPNPVSTARAVPADPPAAVPGSPAEDEALNQYGGQTCHFSTRESLEAAARRYLAERQLIGDKIVRIGD